MKLLASDIHFSYRRRRVLDGATLALQPGELVCLLGANGAGKSTLLKIMLGLHRPARGTVTLDAVPLARWPRRALAGRLAYVPQMHAAPFPYSVRQVVLMGSLPATGLWRSPAAADFERTDRVLAQLGIAHLAARAYTEVSGGERQLALIARALVQQARLLVMDEPLAGLDYGNQVRLLQRLERLAAQGYGILMSTHDPNQPLAGCQRVALLARGRIEENGPPERVLTPQAIHHLYGVHVDVLRSADGRAQAFQRRRDEGDTADTAGTAGMESP